MPSLIRKPSWPRRAILLLAATAGLVVVSWLWAKVHAPAASDLSDDYLAAMIDRAGASTDRLIDDLQSRLKADVGDWQSYSRLGVAYLQKARETGDPTYYAKVEAALQKALEHQPDDYVATAAMGALELARHRFASALEWGERARQINPHRAYAYGVIVDAQVELGRYDEAVDTLQAMIDLRPDVSSYTRAAYLRELHGDSEGALEAMQWAVDAGGPNRENAGWTRVQLGHLHFNRGELDAADADYRTALALYPDYVHALAGAARVHAARGEFDDAIRLYTNVVARMPLPEYVIALGEVYQAAGRPDGARQQFDLARAIEQLYTANGVDTDLEMALFEADHGRVSEETLARARGAYENRPTVYGASVLAWTLYQTGRYADAYDWSQQALQLGTQDALLYFHAGMIANKTGRAEEARTYLAQALAINPHFSLRYGDIATETLNRLRQSATR